MKTGPFNLIVYILFALLFAGAFAAMARNAYGMDLIGFSCLGFALVFLSDVILNMARGKKIGNISPLEDLLLGALAVLFALRVFYIRFEGVELVVSAIGFTLALIYLFKRLSIKTKGVRGQLATIYIAALFFFLVSLGLAPINAKIAEISGMAGFGLIFLVFGYATFRPVIHYKEKEQSTFRYLASIGRNGIVIATAFILMSVYIGLRDFGLIPELYTNSKPQKYIQLVKMAESGEEEPKNGKYLHEEYAWEMETFLKKYEE